MAMVQFGQFLDHDIVLTPEEEGTFSKRLGHVCLTQCNTNDMIMQNKECYLSSIRFCFITDILVLKHVWSKTLNVFSMKAVLLFNVRVYDVFVSIKLNNNEVKKWTHCTFKPVICFF